ncbi:type I-E CRISPR-associated protein Cas7/Cse4/CasC [Nocardiopsis sp. L17-MgMaSL7]|uniref:type I-E CRISPR-associated protein Cas7/Cse4/CasC n=1 Tax=Nocardiopsis sp. L17-MgMaSL7 TaxID=1938893 RepID=UPI000D713954|nr:type I-E CRISPR-associated protein Cas7/Cse4/CasC [Nocardiopsis sp. L17-MgMaSL7]PWV52431.1 CRISPR system Cascade subunit CasC [Nocardiopsis sp. L17-MgMaSL7]
MNIELHLLQSFPTSNLNRDDIGQPKSVTFGGVVRGRVSSQCLKRSARTLFPRYGLDQSELGERTKRLLPITARLLDGVSDADVPSDEARGIVQQALAWMGFAIAEKDLTQYLFFLGPEAAEELAVYCREHWDDLADQGDKRRKLMSDLEKARERHQLAEGNEDKRKARTGVTSVETKIKKLDEVPAAKKKEARKAAGRVLSAGRSVDIALFGRMIANNKDFNVDAASQVAHAISTHAVSTEFDFFTAVDDLKANEADQDAGADMIGVVDFNAACYYRYANVDLDQLRRNLVSGSGATADDGEINELMDRALGAWIRAFVNATPSGKQNSMAAHTRPDTLMMVAREHGSWNLANAFLKPVEGTAIMEDSTERLFAHFSKLRGFYGDDEITKVAASSLSGEVSGLEEGEIVSSLDALVQSAVTASHG